MAVPACKACTAGASCSTCQREEARDKPEGFNGFVAWTNTKEDITADRSAFLRNDRQARAVV
jgi:hypothetical protein